MCQNPNYAKYSGKSNLENIIFMYNSFSSCLFVTYYTLIKSMVKQLNDVHASYNNTLFLLQV